METFNISFYALCLPLFNGGRLRLKCDCTRAETRFRLSAKRTSPFKSAGESVQSTAGNRGVLHTPFACFLFTSPPVRHRVPSRFNWTLPLEMQKENYPSAQIYLRFEFLLVEIGSSLSMAAACSSKRPYISTSNCTLLQLIRMQNRSLVLTNN